MKDTLGFGILGAGLIAPFHCKGVNAGKGMRLVAICDMNRQRSEKLASDFGVKAYQDLSAMLADPDIDIVNVCLPNHLHVDAVLACARAGKHVLTEKPPAMSLKETDAMIDACRAAGVKFGCFVQCRTRKVIQMMKAALDQGRFGRLLQADTIMKWHRTMDYYKTDAWRMSRRSGAGVTVMQAFHYIDLLQYLAGPAALVDARMTNLAHPEVRLEDTLNAFIRFKNGAQGMVEASTAMWPGTDVRIEVHGTDGTAMMAGERMTMWKFREERPEDEQIRLLGNAAQPTGAGGAADIGFLDHAFVIQDMADAIRENREVVIPVSSVRPTTEIVLAMYQSAQKNSAVELPVQDREDVWDWPQQTVHEK